MFDPKTSLSPYWAERFAAADQAERIHIRDRYQTDATERFLDLLKVPRGPFHECSRAQLWRRVGALCPSNQRTFYQCLDAAGYRVDAAGMISGLGLPGAEPAEPFRYDDPNVVATVLEVLHAAGVTAEPGGLVLRSVLWARITEAVAGRWSRNEFYAMMREAGLTTKTTPAGVHWKELAL